VRFEKSLFFAAFAVLLLGSACAPRVSRHRPKSPVEQAPVVRPIAVAPVQEDRPAPQPVREEKPVVVAVSEKKIVEAPVETEEVADTGDGYAHEETKPAASGKKSFYSFSDDEVTTMRRKNRDFKKLHDKLKTCTSRSEKTIAKREQLRDRIISLQNAEYRTPKQDVELRKLRDSERKMLSSRGEDADNCNQLEGKLTEMLQVVYASRGA
jgi:hypothetical protein